MECKHVRLAVAFGVPSKQYGEDIECAVQLADNTAECVTQDTIRQHLRGKLADFKIPRKIHIVKEFPMSPTGKILRSMVANALSSESVADKA